MKYKYPFTKQDGLKNCACACIQMMVKYYKGYISMEELESKLKTNKFGTNAFQMKEVLEELGFKCDGYKLDSIPSDIVVPFIAHVVIDEKYNHFVVVYKVHHNKIVIADPASSIITMQLDDFYKIWDGVILTAHPIKTIHYEKEVKLSNFIFDNLFRYKKEILYLTVISLFFMIFTVLSYLNQLF